MTTQPTRGHISVKGPTYAAFRDACEPLNIRMGRILDELIVDLLEDPKALAAETQYFAEVMDDKLRRRKKKVKWGRAPQNMDHGTMNRLYGKIMDRELAKLDKPVPKPAEVREAVLKMTRPYHTGGLFSEQGLADAEVEVKAAKTKPKREARGSEPPAFHDIPSCIDPTFGKK